MRISTSQIFSQGLSTMQAKQQQLQETELQLSSGLKIMKPSDDPSGAVKVLNLNTNIDVLNQYERNISLAQSALGFQENVMANISNTIQRVRELAIQGNNDSNSEADRSSIASEIYARLDELVTLANTRDANGEYIYAGNRVDSPAFVNNNGSVLYIGDQGQRMVQVGQGSQVAIRDSGDRVFQSIPGGDGSIQVEANAANNGTLLIETFGVNSNFGGDVYTITFSQSSVNDPITYTVTDSAIPANVISTGNYNEGDSLTIAGANLNFSGVPADGDSVVLEPARNKSLFDSVKEIADTLNMATPSAADKAKLHNNMSSSILGLDQALDNINNLRAGVGSRLNNIQSMSDMNLDFKLQLETVLSETQDLDYAEAISRFNLQLTALQAAQQAFVKTSNLSLFQYL